MLVLPDRVVLEYNLDVVVDVEVLVLLKAYRKTHIRGSDTVLLITDIGTSRKIVRNPVFHILISPSVADK